MRLTEEQLKEVDKAMRFIESHMSDPRVVRKLADQLVRERGNKPRTVTPGFVSMRRHLLAEYHAGRVTADQVVKSEQHWFGYMRILELAFNRTASEIRMRLIHFLIELHQVVAKEQAPGAASEVKCKRGCSACCYQSVTISRDEAKYLQALLTDEQIATLKEQAAMPQDPSGWAKNWPKNRCVFLKNGECSIYEDRPAVCRNLAVVSDPKFCDLHEFPGGETHNFNVPMAQVTASAMFAILECDTMPIMLLKYLKR